MLDIAGKLHEKMIQMRLRNNLDLDVGYAVKKFGFWKGRSTISAIEKVIAKVREVWTVSRKARLVCFFLTFVSKNAFNIAKCEDILDILEHKFNGEPENLTIIDYYLDKRNLIVETTECL